ncbi:MAG: hypothetical protein SGI83_08600 [Bacteroidota bacterium]|nr:hypothetical protein [Bacteroidota bacterium]
MKNRIFVILLVLLHGASAMSQQRHTLAPFVGTWKATGIALPMTFSYNNKIEKVIPLSILQQRLQNDPDGEVKKSVAELEKSLPALLEKIKFDIYENELYSFSANNKNIQGSCRIFDPIKAPGVETDEHTFIKYVENYGYNGGFELYDHTTKTRFFANLKIKNNDTTLV